MTRTRELYVPKKRLSSAERQRRSEQKLRAAADAAGTHFVLSHGHCLDGVGSAIVLRRALGDGVGVAYSQPNHILRALTWLREEPANDRTLIIADLSLQPRQFDSIVAACHALKTNGWTIQWYDHHHKQWEGLDLGRLRKHLEVLVVNDDATESGASLVQQALAPHDEFARKLSETIRDRDLWWNKTPASEQLEFALRWMEPEAFFDHFIGKGAAAAVVDEVIENAAAQQAALNTAHQNELIGQARFWTTSKGQKLAIIYGWMPKNVGLHALLQQDNVQVAINVNPGGRMSIRSNKDWTVCHKIAGKFNGGGHPNASGGVVGVDSWMASKWYVARRGKVAQVDNIAEAAIAEMELFSPEALA
jgi:oligoribonuclease NrnB/cAMP/cGMP phosphodiesterase (DHH superfamily)